MQRLVVTSAGPVYVSETKAPGTYAVGNGYYTATGVLLSALAAVKTRAQPAFGYLQPIFAKTLSMSAARIGGLYSGSMATKALTKTSGLSSYTVKLPISGASAAAAKAVFSVIVKMPIVGKSGIMSFTRGLPPPTLFMKALMRVKATGTFVASKISGPISGSWRNAVMSAQTPLIAQPIAAMARAGTFAAEVITLASAFYATTKTSVYGSFGFNIPLIATMRGVSKSSVASNQTIHGTVPISGSVKTMAAGRWYIAGAEHLAMFARSLARTISGAGIAGATALASKTQAVVRASDLFRLTEFFYATWSSFVKSRPAQTITFYSTALASTSMRTRIAGTPIGNMVSRARTMTVWVPTLGASTHLAVKTATRTMAAPVITATAKIASVAKGMAIAATKFLPVAYLAAPARIVTRGTGSFLSLPLAMLARSVSKTAAASVGSFAIHMAGHVTSTTAWVWIVGGVANVTGRTRSRVASSPIGLFVAGVTSTARTKAYSGAAGSYRALTSGLAKVTTRAAVAATATVAVVSRAFTRSSSVPAAKFPAPIKAGTIVYLSAGGGVKGTTHLGAKTTTAVKTKPAYVIAMGLSARSAIRTAGTATYGTITKLFIFATTFIGTALRTPLNRVYAQAPTSVIPSNATMVPTVSRPNFTFLQPSPTFVQGPGVRIRVTVNQTKLYASVK